MRVYGEIQTSSERGIDHHGCVAILGRTRELTLARIGDNGKILELEGGEPVEEFKKELILWMIVPSQISTLRQRQSLL